MYKFEDDFRRIALLSNTLRVDNQELQRQADQSDDLRRIALLSNTLRVDNQELQRQADQSDDLRRIALLSNTLRVDNQELQRQADQSDDLRRIALLSNTLRVDNQELQRQADQFATVSWSPDEILRQDLDEIQRQVNQPVEALKHVISQHAEEMIQETLKASRVLPDRLDQSMIGFARLSRLSDAIRTTEPYSTPAAELITEELGGAVEFLPDQNANERDAAAIHAGLKPELIAFPPAAYGDVVLTAGFSFCITPMAVPRAVESGDLGATLDPKHWRVLTELEQRLRHVVEETLTKLDGSHWIKRRVPQPMRQCWEKRQEEDRTAGRPVYAAIQYADFMDLAGIVGRSDNWREAFQRIFRNKEDFITSLHRLHPVRKAIAHSRPLGRADVLTLVTEVNRIFGVLGIRVLN